MKKIQLRSVGIVRTNLHGTTSKIIVKPEFSQCLKGMEKYSHFVVLYWMHKVDKETDLTEAFANRTPFRPNPIGLIIVELISREGNILLVRGLDAFDGSPVIDIKPYTGHPKDLVLDFKSPDKF